MPFGGSAELRPVSTPAAASIDEPGADAKPTSGGATSREQLDSSTTGDGYLLLRKNT
jgi:hypothetical protein